MPYDIETIVTGCVQERRHLTWCPGCHLGGAACSFGGRHERVFGHVAHQKAPSDGVGEGTMEDGVAVLDGPSAQATPSVTTTRLGQRGVQVRQLVGCEGLKRDVAEGG